MIKLNSWYCRIVRFMLTDSGIDREGLRDRETWLELLCETLNDFTE